MPYHNRHLTICHLISGDLWAGAEVMGFHLIKHLSSYPQNSLIVILLNNGRLSEELHAAGIKVHVFDEDKLSFLSIIRGIYSILRVESPDIIHSHRYKENLLAFLTTRFLGNIKLVTTQHGLPESQKKYTSLAGKIKSNANFFVLCRHFHKIIAVSNNINSFFTENLKFNPMKVQTIHNGIKIIEKNSLRESSDKFIIGSSGRFFPVKDYPLMVDIAMLTTGYGNISFELAGDGPERVGLEQTISQYNLGGSFNLKGHLDDMDPFYDGLDIYINTSLHEGIPMTILEAMVHGLPIIAPKVGGITEIIEDGVEGFLIDSRDPLDYAEKCLLLFRDRELRKNMSIAAREKVSNEFSREKMTERYLKCYRELVSAKENLPALPGDP